MGLSDLLRLTGWFLRQEVFNQRFDAALQDLVSDLLSRIEQMFPVPGFKQVRVSVEGSRSHQLNNNGFLSLSSGRLVARRRPRRCGGLPAGRQGGAEAAADQSELSTRTRLHHR